MIGFALAINQIVVVLTPPAFGALRDATGSYVYGWIFVTGAAAIALAQLSRRSAGAA